MKKLNQGVIAAVLLSLASVTPSFAIEQLTIHVANPDVTLWWPSTEGETYLIRYKGDLSTNTTWTVLSDSWAAATGTNWTSYTDSGAAMSMMMAGGGGGSGAPAGPQMVMMSAGALNTEDMPLPMDSPPLPWDTRFWSTPPETVLDATALNAVPAGVAIAEATLDSGGGGGYSPLMRTTNADGSVTGTGYYEVVKIGVHLFGWTNGIVLSGTVPLNIEYASVDTNQVFSLWLVNTNGSNYMQGAAFPDYSATFSNTLAGSWDTSLTTNGTYVVQLGVEVNDGLVYLDQPVSVVVSNLAWFPDPYFVAGYGLYLGVQTVYHDGAGTWHLNLYNETNRYLGGLDGFIDTNGYFAYPGYPGPGVTLANYDLNTGDQFTTPQYTLVYSTDTNHPISMAAAAGGGGANTLTNATKVEPMAWGNLNPTYATVVYQNPFGSSQGGYQSVKDLMVVMAGALWYPGGHPFTLNPA